MILDAHHPLRTDALRHAPLLAVGRGEAPLRRPVWFMRQAGRSLPEYRSRREGVPMLEACLLPDLVCELTLQPVRRYGVDAAIFFSDIVVPLQLAGIPVTIVPNVGPVLEHPVRTLQEVQALPPLEDLEPVREAVRLLVAALGSTPLIGFAGAPFTLASYLVEGGPSRHHLKARAMMHADPEAWSALCSWVMEVSGLFLRAQAEAGASVVQIFDSWAESLGRDEYERHVLAYTREMLHQVDDPRIVRVHFGLGSVGLLTSMAETGAEVLGVDYRLPLDEASQKLQRPVPLQGNINPALLTAPWPIVEEHVRDVLWRGAQAPGHIVNLGHGVPPSTDPAVLHRIVDFVHSVDPLATVSREEESQHG